MYIFKRRNVRFYDVAREFRTGWALKFYARRRQR